MAPRRKIDLANLRCTKQAEIDLEHVNQTSPIDGIVPERLVNPNEFTKPVSDRSLAFPTPCRWQPRSRKKNAFRAMPDSCRYDFSGVPQRGFKGTVAKIDPNIDPVTRTFTAYVKFR